MVWHLPLWTACGAGAAGFVLRGLPLLQVWPVVQPVWAGDLSPGKMGTRPNEYRVKPEKRLLSNPQQALSRAVNKTDAFWRYRDRLEMKAIPKEWLENFLIPIGSFLFHNTIFLEFVNFYFFVNWKITVIFM